MLTPGQIDSTDREMMEALGGIEIRSIGRGFTCLGTHTLYPEDPERGDPATTIKVEVCQMPALFWRFTISRPKDEVGTFPPEVIVVATGSGTFREYWPTATMIANNMINVKEQG